MTTSIVVDKISINVSGIHSNINLCLNIKCKNYWIKNISANKVIVLHKIKQINGEASSTVYYRTMDIHLTENETRWWRSYIQLRVKFIRHFYDISIESKTGESLFLRRDTRSSRYNGHLFSSPSIRPRCVSFVLHTRCATDLIRVASPPDIYACPRIISLRLPSCPMANEIKAAFNEREDSGGDCP